MTTTVIIFQIDIIICILAVLIFTILFITPNDGWAWSPVGHRVAARIAQDRLKRAALAAVRNLLGPGMSLENISTWADEQQGIPGSNRWHYVDVPITEAGYDPKYCQPGGSVVSNIEDFKKI